MFIKGRIAESGGAELADELEANGYAKYGLEAAPTGGAVTGGRALPGVLAPS